MPSDCSIFVPNHPVRVQGTRVCLEEETEEMKNNNVRTETKVIEQQIGGNEN